MSDPSGTGNNAPGLTTAAVLLLLWAALTLIVRLWVKLKKADSWGSDDSIITVSFCAALAHVIAVCLAVNHGYGKPWDSVTKANQESILKAMYAAQIFYLASVGLTKVSAGLFTGRFLARDRVNVRAAYILTAVCGVWALASILAIAIRGDLAAPWDTRDGSQTTYSRWLGIEISGFVLETSIVGLCVYFIWGLQMPVGRRLSVSAIFCSRLVLAPIVAIRLWYLSPSQNSDPTHPNALAGVFTEAVMDLAFMLASITCLKPFMRPFHSGYSVSTTKGATYNTTGKASRSDAYLMLSAARSVGGAKDKPAVRVTSQGDHQAPLQQPARLPPVFRPDHVDHRTTIMSADRERHSDENSEQMIISKTQAWDVSYDDERSRGSVGRPSR